MSKSERYTDDDSEALNKTWRDRYDSYHSQILSYGEDVQNLINKLQSMQRFERISIAPFATLDELIPVLGEIGEGFELRFEVVAPSKHMCDCTAILCFNAEGLKMRVIQPIPGRNYNIDYEYVKEYDYADRVEIEAFLRGVGMIKNSEIESLIVITKGDKDRCLATVKDSFMDLHSHPSDSTIDSSFSDRGGTIKRFDENQERIMPTPGISKIEKERRGLSRLLRL